jgi:hypothetical protein
MLKIFAFATNIHDDDRSIVTVLLHTARASVSNDSNWHKRHEVWHWSFRLGPMYEEIWSQAPDSYVGDFSVVQ